ncbi:MAG: iron-sulfur cluster assembly protein, partial [Dokdonella sp.]
MGGYSSTSEPIRFERDCDAVMVPQGEVVRLPAGQAGYITQALGGSLTVFVDGNLFRITGEDADAIGKTKPAPLELPPDAADADVERVVWDQLRTCFDPEIPVNIVDLGLVYDCDLERADDGSRKVNVRMTLTAPGCGMGDI